MCFRATQGSKKVSPSESRMPSYFEGLDNNPDIIEITIFYSFFLHLYTLDFADILIKNLLIKALDIERQCVTELEGSFYVLSSEHDRIKMTSENKLTNANNLVAGVQDRSLEVKQSWLLPFKEKEKVNEIEL
ncbi:hypothetical protein CASFOL_028609 [Castilleja foliolosa]|uniref:Uncharacterized protein n=1 Tax=Castilleja foliolosa TaxID=1961234 RepID=A0ABD3CBP7_9LAMI